MSYALALCHIRYFGIVISFPDGSPCHAHWNQKKSCCFVLTTPGFAGFILRFSCPRTVLFFASLPWINSPSRITTWICNTLLMATSTFWTFCTPRSGTRFSFLGMLRFAIFACTILFFFWAFFGYNGAGVKMYVDLICICIWLKHLLPGPDHQWT